MQPYQAADGRWIYFNGTKHYFDTQQEAKQMASKEQYAAALQEEITKLAQVANRMADLKTVYFDRGYNSGGANAITDEDLAGLGITAATLGGGITVGEQLDLLLNNGETVQGDYDSTLNKLRTDV